MKILEINKFNFPKRGAERHYFDVISLLESSGHEVAVFSMEHENNLPSNWQKYFLSKVGYTSEYSLLQKIKGVFRMFYSLEARIKINGILDEFKPDIVHIHNIYHQLSPAILFEIKKRKIPIVMTVHDFKIVCPNHSLFLNGKKYERCKEGRFYECFLDKCVKDSYFKSFLATLEMYWHDFLGTYKKNVDKFIVPSEFVRRNLIERGISAEKLSVLPHFTLKSAQILNLTSGIEKGKKTALYLGAISKNKGVGDLIDIFKKIDGVELHLAGNIEDDFVFEKNKNIKHLGFLNNNEVLSVISGASCIISGSKLPETFGLVALEAVSQGKPFFGFNVGAFGEIIKNGENGYLAQDKASLEKAVKDFFQGKISFNQEDIAKKTNEKYDSGAYISKLENIFREVLTH